VLQAAELGASASGGGKCENTGVYRGGSSARGVSGGAVCQRRSTARNQKKQRGSGRVFADGMTCREANGKFREVEDNTQKELDPGTGSKSIAGMCW